MSLFTDSLAFAESPLLVVEVKVGFMKRFVLAAALTVLSVFWFASHKSALCLHHIPYNPSQAGFLCSTILMTQYRSEIENLRMPELVTVFRN